jgi:ribulose kinase
VGKLCETAARDLAIPTSVVVGSGLIDSYAGWVGTVGAPVEASSNHDEFPLYTRMALVAGTSTCHTVVSREPVFVNGIWGPYKDFVIPGYWMSEGGQVATGR